MLGVKLKRLVRVGVIRKIVFFFLIWEVSWKLEKERVGERRGSKE